MHVKDSPALAYFHSCFTIVPPSTIRTTRINIHCNSVFAKKSFSSLHKGYQIDAINVISLHTNDFYSCIVC